MCGAVHGAEAAVRYGHILTSHFDLIFFYNNELIMLKRGTDICLFLWLP